jgi:hypothetical protein
MLGSMNDPRSHIVVKNILEEGPPLNEVRIVYNPEGECWIASVVLRTVSEGTSTTIEIAESDLSIDGALRKLSGAVGMKVAGVLGSGGIT